MIITTQKPIEEVLEFIGDKKKVFLIGCKVCATTCKTGGEPELADIEKKLAEKGKTVAGKAVLDPACNIMEVKRLIRQHADAINGAGVVVSYACGGGTQALAENLPGVNVYPGNNTMFQGDLTRSGLDGKTFEQKCSMCGECILAITGGICPVTRCPKGLLNGPCGGIKNGKCEVNKETDCVWILIYERLKSLGRLDEMRKVKRPKNYSKAKRPQNLKTK